MSVKNSMFAPSTPNEPFFMIGELQIRAGISNNELRKLINRNGLPISFDAAIARRDQVVNQSASREKRSQVGFARNGIPDLAVDTR